MEQKYVNVSRGGGGRAAPSRPQSHGYPAKKGPARPQQARRSPLVGLFWAFYKLLTVVAALIVAVYVGFHVMVRPPEQVQLPPPTQGGAQTDPGVVGGVGDASEDQAEPLVRREGVYNILLAGTDKEGFRTDTMMVLCYDIPNRTVGVVSVPRDTLIDRGAGKNPKLVYGPGGVKQRVEDISQMLGIPIDYYVKVNLKGFIALIDYVGGVDFYVPCDMSYDDPYQDLSIHFTKGQQHLGGQQAMEVARFRKNNDGSGYSDVGRTQTQQKLLVALAKKVLSWNSLNKLNGFVEIFNKYVDTDLALNDMLYFASQAVNIDTAAGVETFTLEGNGDGHFRGYSYCYELDKQSTLDAVNRLVNPYTRALTLDDLNLTRASG